MGGYRVRHGLPLGANLTLIARKSSLSRAETLALWISILDFASQNRPRGSTIGLDAEEVAALLEIAPDKTTLALTGFCERRMLLQNGMVAGWEQAQYSSTARVQAFRARRRHENPPNPPERPGS